MLRWMLASMVVTVCALPVDDKPSFVDKDISGRHFKDESLNGVDFSGATCVGCSFTRCSLKKAKFKGAVMTSAAFYDTDVSETDFTGVTAPSQTIQFLNCKLDKANFEGVNKNIISLSFRNKCSLKEANLQKAKIGEITNCDLSRADLRGANLRAVTPYTISSARFTGAFYDDNTAFPEGFDPKAAGMKLKKEEKKEDKKSDDKK